MAAAAAACGRAAGMTLALSRARGTAAAPALISPPPEMRTTHTRATTSNLETCMLAACFTFPVLSKIWSSIAR
ncbi:hypothetical protein SORBI_3003G063100 [Sorghum bicolor]|uniref:Uncharacterized protein n=1 Tax=Sorghum bicolor TaxID=4558 RepID=A0A1B6Q1L4_SORBI|nr:hypothetical protein SORBI_3003G063100 [Sorghum bicolor]